MKIFGMALFEPPVELPLRQAAQLRLDELERHQFKLEMDRIDSLMLCAAGQAKVEFLRSHLADKSVLHDLKLRK